MNTNETIEQCDGTTVAVRGYRYDVYRGIGKSDGIQQAMFSSRQQRSSTCECETEDASVTRSMQPKVNEAREVDSRRLSDQTALERRVQSGILQRTSPRRRAAGVANAEGG